MEITRGKILIIRTMIRENFTDSQYLYFDSSDDVETYFEVEEVGNPIILPEYMAVEYFYNLPTGDIRNIYHFTDLTLFNLLFSKENGDNREKSLHQRSLSNLPGLNSWYY